MNFERYTATISVNISVCINAIKIIESIKNNSIKIENGGSIREKILQILTEYVIVKISCLFDRGGDVVSFEKIKKHLNAEMKTNQMIFFENEYEKIKKKYGNLIERIENNRKIGIAHVQKKEELGWDDGTCKKIQEIFGDIEGANKVVDENYVFLNYTNFPFEDTKEMLNKLQNLINQLWGLKIIG